MKHLPLRSQELWAIPVKYAVVIERGPTSYGPQVPDLPGCVAAAEDQGGGVHADPYGH